MALSQVKNLRSEARPSFWSFAEITGRLVEVSSAGASAALTVVFGLVREAQERGEPVGWTTAAESFFYPPDVAEAGIDLAALAIVRVPRPESIARAGEKLLRSGAFGLVVLDLGAADVPMALQSRLAGLSHHHQAALVCLTKKEARAFSLSSLISLRLHAQKRPTVGGGFACGLRPLKDKRRGPTWSYEGLYHGAAGLC